MKWDRLIPWVHAHDWEIFLWAAGLVLVLTKMGL